MIRHSLLLCLSFVLAVPASAQKLQVVSVPLGVEVRGQLSRADAEVPYDKSGRCYRVEGVRGRLIEIQFAGGRESAMERFESADCLGPKINSRMPERPRTSQVSVLIKDKRWASEPFVLMAAEIQTAAPAGQPFHGLVTETDPGGWALRHDCLVLQAKAGQVIEPRVTYTDGPGFYVSVHPGERCGDDVIGFGVEAPAKTVIRRATAPTAGSYSISIKPQNWKFARYALTLDVPVAVTSVALITKIPSIADANQAISAGQCEKGLQALKLREARFEDHNATHVRAQLAEQGICTVKDMAEARRLYTAAGWGGSHQARYRAARLMLDGVGGPKDEAKARNLLRGVEGNESARFLLGRLQRDGVGGPVDLEGAEASFKYASDRGWAGAASALTRLQLARPLSPFLRERATLLVAEAATAGDRDALAELRRLAAENKAVGVRLGATLAAMADSASRAEGRHLLRSAASTGNRDAALALAASLAEGTAAERREAVRVYGEATRSEKLDHLARYLLADLQLNGRGRLPATKRKVGRVCQQPNSWDALQPALGRWGLGPQHHCQDSEVMAEAARAAERLHSLALATVARDPVAATLLSAEFEQRCQRSTTPALAACAAWASVMSLQSDMQLFSQHYALQQLNPFNLVSGGVRRALDIARGFDPQTGQAPNPKLAMTFYTAAIMQGPDLLKAAAHQRMYELYDGGIDVPRDPKQAADHLERAARLGGPQALYKQAMDALSAARTPADRRSAASYLRAAADAGVIEAAWRYAFMLEKGEAASRRGHADIGTYYELAAQSGHVPSMIGAAKAHANGWGRPVDMDKAEAWYVRAARAGNAEAAWRVAVIYSQRSDHRGSIPWLKRAAKGGWPGASDTLARLQARGIRERSLGGFLLDALDLVGDVAGGMAEIHAANMEAERIAQEQMIVMGYLPGSPSSGSSSGSGSGGSGSDGGSSGGASGSGSTAAAGSDSGAGSAGTGNSSSGASGADGSGAGGVGSGGDSGGSDGSYSDSGTSAGSGSESLSLDSDGGGSGSGSGGSSGSDDFVEPSTSSGSSSGGAIIVSDGAAERAALEAKQAALKAAEDARTAQRLAEERAASAKFEREQAERLREYEEGRKRALIACHGSLEAAARAKVSCQ